MRKPFAAVLLCVLLCSAAVATAAPAAARSYDVSRFEAEIVLDADGSIHVEERITFRFVGAFQGVYRVIPYGYAKDGPIGMPWLRGMLDLELRSIEDDSGRELVHEEQRARGKVQFRIHLPGAVNAERTVVLRYDVNYVVRSHRTTDAEFAAYDELYWNVTGNAWEVPIREAVVRVILPAGVPASDVRTSAYTGLYGGRSEDYVTEQEEQALVVRTTRPLLPNEGLTLSVAIPRDRLSAPTGMRRFVLLAQANWMVGLAPLCLGLWLLYWWLRGRDRLDRTIVAEFERPEGLAPSEAGILMDDRLDTRDLSAAFVDLAVRGVISIEGADSRSKTAFVAHRETWDKAELAAWERRLLDDAFGEDDRVTMTSLTARLPLKLPAIRDSLLARVVSRGLFPKRPDHVIAQWMGLAGLSALLLVVVGVLTGAPLLYWVLAVPAAILAFVAARFMPRRTHAGLVTLARLKGLEDYIVTAERERMRHMPLSALEALLPFAVAFGAHERWAARLQELFAYTPAWYQSQTATPWWESINWMQRSVQAGTMPVSRVSGTRSGPGGWGSKWGSGTWSGGTGFGGGGFSGGGFGGGGGGAW